MDMKCGSRERWRELVALTKRQMRKLPKNEEKRNSLDEIVKRKGFIML